MKTDHEIIETLEGLYAAVVADVLDSLGYRNQTLSSDIRALTPSNQLCGRVFTGRAVSVSECPAEPYKLEMAAVDLMKTGDVFVVDAGHNKSSGFWGELLTTACQYKGVRGVVMTACCRDMWALNQLDFPVFGIGYHPADSKGRADIVEIAQPIEMDGVNIDSGDFILVDQDGAVVIPKDVVEETLRLALEKVSGENIVRDELRAGLPISEVFEKYGIL